MKPHVILPKLMSRERILEALCTTLESLPMDRAWRIEWAEHKATRSNAQNNYWHGVIVDALVAPTGYEHDEVHEFLCGSHFGWKDKRVPKTPRNPSGLDSVPVRTTTRDEHGNHSLLSKTEFADLVDFGIRFAAKRGIVIPPPDPNYFEHEERAA